MKQNDIIYYLNRDYNISVSRNTLSDYLRELKRNRYIAGDRGVYCVRRFQNYEIKMILDNLMFTKALPAQDIEKILNKLKPFVEPEYRKNWNYIYFLDKLEHTENRYICENIEKITFAIENRKKIQITICKYNIEAQLKDTGTRIVDPYYIVTEKSRYYLLCHSGRNDVEPRRIDRISKVKVLQEQRVEIEQIDKYANHSFQIDVYMREHIYMYSGEIERITIRIKRENISDFIDWYGKNYRIIACNECNIDIQIKANVNAVYFWALQYGNIAEVLKPESLRCKIRGGLEAMLARYQKHPD